MIELWKCFSYLEIPIELAKILSLPREELLGHQYKPEFHPGLIAKQKRQPGSKSCLWSNTAKSNNTKHTNYNIKSQKTSQVRNSPVDAIISCDLGLVLCPSIEEPWARVIGYHTSAKLEPEGAISLACSCKWDW